MASHTPRRTYSDSTPYKVERTRSTAREERRKSESRPQYRYPTPERVEGGNRGKRTTTTSASRSRTDKRYEEKGYRAGLSRSKTVGGGSERVYEQLPRRHKEYEKRHSGRPGPSHEGISQHKPLRKEHRSVIESGSRSRGDDAQAG